MVNAHASCFFVFVSYGMYYVWTFFLRRSLLTSVLCYILKFYLNINLQIVKLGHKVSSSKYGPTNIFEWHLITLARIIISDAYLTIIVLCGLIEFWKFALDVYPVSTSLSRGNHSRWFTARIQDAPRNFA